jgi:UDP-N-acetylmuramate dehydrogenase
VSLVDQDLALVTRTREQCGFRYRGSAFRPGEILTGATLDLPRGDSTAAREHLQQMRAARKRTQPLGLPNAGSIFKNPPGDYAGRLIEAAGLKGRRVGDAEISELHANFIVNRGAARAEDVLALATVAQSEVLRRFGITLEWEVRRLGSFAES